MTLSPKFFIGMRTGKWRNPIPTSWLASPASGRSPRSCDSCIENQSGTDPQDPSRLRFVVGTSYFEGTQRR